MKVEFRKEYNYYYVSSIFYGRNLKAHKRKELRPTGGVRIYMKKILPEIFPSIEFIENCTGRVDFLFTSESDEAYFILWSNNGVEI
jgi:hypothetical protein